jgi:DNA-binding transcriptional ArsR family regulator
VTRALLAAEPVFAALGDPTRLRLVSDLGERGPRSLAKLAATTALSRQAVTKHLQTLENAGVVRSERVGRERVWRLEATRLSEAGTALDAASRRWDAALARLRAHVEKAIPVDGA